MTDHNCSGRPHWMDWKSREQPNRLQRIGFFAVTSLIMLSILFPERLLAQGDATTFWLKLHSVTVEQQREASGDRPYFFAVEFRTRLREPGSTRIQVREDEPHDFVSKNAYRTAGRLTTRRDHLFNGETIPIPFWMGEYEWADVRVQSREEALEGFATGGTEIFGVLIFALDNNNMPPHVIRDFANRLGELVRRLVVDQLERDVDDLAVAAAALGNPEQLARRFESRAAEMALDMLEPMKVAEWLVQATAGSTGNPDIPIATFAFIFPAVEGVEPARSEDGFLGEARTVRLPVVGNFGIRSAAISPSRWREPLVFSGGGARYRVDAHMFDRPPLAKPLERLAWQFSTGADGKRDGARVIASVFMKDGRRVETQISPRREIPGRSVYRAEVTTPDGLRYCDIERVEVAFRFQGGPFDSDDWDVNAINLHAGSSMVFSAAASRGGAVLHRFNNDRRLWRHDPGIPDCTAPTSDEAVMDVVDALGMSPVLSTLPDRTRRQRFANPMVDDRYRLDWCREWGAECGRPAADAFCREAGFERAESFEKDDNIGLRSPTKPIASRPAGSRICTAENCDGFRSIVCVGRR